MIRPITLPAVLALLLPAGCASNEGSRVVKSAVKTAMETTVEYDENKREMTVLGPPLRIEPSHATNWRLRHMSRADGASSMAIVLELYHTEWQFFDSAKTAEGEQLEMFRIISEVVPRKDGEAPIAYELYHIDVSPDQLERWAQTGADIVISGRTGEGSFSVPAHYFLGFRGVMQRTAAPVR